MGSTRHEAPGGNSADAEDELSQGRSPVSAIIVYQIVSTLASLPGITIHPSLPRLAFASSSTKEDKKPYLSLAVPMRSREPNREANRR